MVKVKMPCPSCGGGNFSLTGSPKSVDKVVSATCAKCGHIVSEDEVKEFLIEVSSEAVADLKAALLRDRQRR